MSESAPQESPFGPVDFASYVMSIASSAMVTLGQLPDPATNVITIELDTARHLIDVLPMLEVKTKGNLDATEQKLVTSLLYDLRVGFVEAQRKHGTATP